VSAVAIALATLGLATRVVGDWSWLVVAGGGVAGLAVPLSRTTQRPGAHWLGVTCAGAALFVLTRTLWSTGISPGRTAVAAGIVAGVAEEALFRRGLYGLLERWGAHAAVIGSAALFGLVHIPMYGWRAFPLDVAAGLVFGWQRWSSGSWTTSAVTHAFANVVQYL
jgi:membrane protease YdiL (CAAX protease family)